MPKFSPTDGCGCCQSGDDFPAWTVYHSEVSDKLHYYIAALNQNSFLYLFYEGTGSGGELVYKNCPSFSGVDSLIKNSCEADPNSTYRIYLEKTSTSLTGASVSNTWIKASKVNRVEISGVFFPNTPSGIYSTFDYDSGRPQYSMGRHYCGSTGFPGALRLTSGNSVHFSLLPYIAGRVITSYNPEFALLQTNDDNFNLYTENVSNNKYVNSQYSFSPSTISITTGIYHHLTPIAGSGTFSFIGTFTCPIVGSVDFYSFTREFENSTSGTRVELLTNKFCLDYLNPLTNGCSPLSTGINNYDLDIYLNIFTPHTINIQLENSYLRNQSFSPFFKFSGYLPTNNGTMGACDCTIGGLGGGSTPFFTACLNNDVASGSGYSYIPYISLSGNSGAFDEYQFMIPKKPILSLLSVFKSNDSQSFSQQSVAPTEVYYTSSETCSSQGLNNFNANVSLVYNSEISVSILDLNSSKHILDEYSPSSDFISFSATPIVAGTGSQSNPLGACPSGSGSYSYSFESGGIPWNITCLPATSGTFSLSHLCRSDYSLTISNISSNILQLIVPSSDFCIP